MAEDTWADFLRRLSAMICMYQICVDKTGLQDKLQYKEIMEMGSRATSSLDSYLDSLPTLRTFIYLQFFE